MQEPHQKKQKDEAGLPAPTIDADNPPPHILDLPPDMIGKILSRINDEERCRVIPVISKRMLQIHKQHPSTRTNYGIRSRFRNQEELPGPFITLPMVKWLGQLCGTLESLTVDKRGGAMQAGMLPQLLMAARDATKLRSIRMLSCPIEMADLCSLALLSQLRHLTLEKCPLSVDGPQMYGLQCLSSLQSLQSIHLRGIDGSVEAGHALCKALARLPELSLVKIYEAERNFLLGMAPSIPLLTQIRTLALIGSVMLRLSPDVSAGLRNVGEMSQLTGLYCGWSDTFDPYFPVFSLPLLEKLQIFGRFGHSPDAAVLRAEYAKLSRKLTLLALNGGTQTLVDQMVAIPALGGLQRLFLDDLQLTHGLPAALTQSLTSLIELRLCSGCIPLEISSMTALQILLITGKDTIKLKMKDVDTVAALPSLHTLTLLSESEVGAADKESSNVLIALSRKFPSLKLIVQ